MGYGKKDRLPPFVAVTWALLNSKAFIALNYASAKALPYFLGKVKYDSAGIKITYHDPQRYLVEFSFSYSEGKRYGFSSSTFHKVIRELMGKGFIDPVDKGGLRSDGKSYSLFRLSKRWEEYGTGAFKHIEWKYFCPRPRLKATPKSETYSSKKGTTTASEDNGISHSKAVGEFSG